MTGYNARRGRTRPAEWRAFSRGGPGGGASEKNNLPADFLRAVLTGGTYIPHAENELLGPEAKRGAAYEINR